MKRRSFLSLLGALPVVGVPKASPLEANATMFDSEAYDMTKLNSAVHQIHGSRHTVMKLDGTYQLRASFKIAGNSE